jgi:DNA-binding LacI/PurR family transcriptional regulator/signal transduction histidine kinase
MTGAARRPTLGVLVDWLESEYQSAVLGGVIEAARENDANVVCLVGGVLHAPRRFGAQRNRIYDLAHSDGIDGLVILAGTLGNFRGLDDLSNFCAQFRPRPMVSIAAELPGTTSILIDGEHALREGVRHFVADHGYRRIAFLGGPDGNLEARARLRTFGEVVDAHGVRPPDAWLAAGDFQYDSGVDAVRRLLDEENADFEAIVVANDQMALGVIDALRARGKRVPRDVAVMGFDDIREAAYSAPPLTTVRQPLHGQGRLGVEVLLQRLRGDPVGEIVTLPTELVLRRSCGCYSDARQVSPASVVLDPVDGPGRTPTVTEAIASARDRIVAAVREPVDTMVHGVTDDWGAAMLDALVADLRDDTDSEFAEAVDALMERSLEAGGTGTAWQPALSALRRELMPCLASDPDMRARAEDLLQGARVVVADAIEHALAQRRLVADRRARILSETAEAISASLDVATLADVLADRLPRLGVASSYVVIHDRTSHRVKPIGDPPALREEVRRLVFAQVDGQTPIAEERGAFITDEIVPAGVLPPDRQYTLIVEPLFFKDESLGYAAFEIGPLDGLLYEALRERVSGVLNVALLIEELVSTSAERAGLVADLQGRAAELQLAYSALQDNQQRLLTAEKMASLGRITANIAHEMNTPLAAVRAALVEIDRRATEYASSIGDAEVTDADHAEIAAEMRASLGIATSAAERAAGFVRGIKTQTRDISVQERIRFDPTPVIEEALLLLSYDLRRSGCQLEFRPPEDPVWLLGMPGLLSQVVTNLVTNAVDAMPPDGGTITLTLSELDGRAQLVVQDTGSGIPEELRDKVFEPMFTTKPFGKGTGLGLSIVHDLITGPFGGSVVLDSELGVGTTFTVRLPLPEAA